MRVSVIIPAWNLWQFTAACLRSLAEHSQGEELEVLVVDNGSSDATVQELEVLGHNLWGPRFHALRQPENLGFAKACNLGAQAASGELLFFLNNDTTCTPGWLPPLRAACQTAGVGAVGPLLLYPHGTVQHCGIVFSPFREISHLYEAFPGTHPLVRQERSLQAITGAALMLRRSDFWDCGGFYEGYCNGFEDLDLCFSLRQKGLELRVVGQSVLYHHTSQTPGRFARDAENGQLFSQRWGEKLQPDLHRLARQDGYALSISAGLRCWPEASAAVQTALHDGLEALPVAQRPDYCAAMLQKEPLWQEGWLLHMDQLQRQCRWQEAVQAGLAALDFFPTPAVHRALLSPLRQCGLQQELGEVMASLQRMLAAEQQIRENRQRVLAASRTAEANGDAELVALLIGWLTRHPC